MSDVDHHAVYHDLVFDLWALEQHFEKKGDSRITVVQQMRKEIYAMARADGIDADTESPIPEYLPDHLLNRSQSE